MCICEAVFERLTIKLQSNNATTTTKAVLVHQNRLNMSNKSAIMSKKYINYHLQTKSLFLFSDSDQL